MALSRGKSSFSSINSKEKKEKQKKGKKGGFRARWGGPLGHLTWPLNPPKEKQNRKQKINKNKKQQIRRVWSQVRWPFGPPHLTLKPPKKKTEKKKKRKKIPKMSFSVISQNFLCFLLGVRNFPFLTTWPKKRAPQKHYKIGVSANIFLKKTYASRNGHLWTKNKFRNSSYHLFVFCSSL